MYLLIVMRVIPQVCVVVINKTNRDQYKSLVYFKACEFRQKWKQIVNIKQEFQFWKYMRV